MDSLATRAAAVVLVVELTVVLLRPSGGVTVLVPVVITFVEIVWLELLVTTLLVLGVVPVPDAVLVVATYETDIKEKLEKRYL